MGEREVEREAVVAWLRKEATHKGASAIRMSQIGMKQCLLDDLTAERIYRYAADAIERGDHLKDQTHDR